MDDVKAARAPMHLWIVGVLSLLWNGFGYQIVMAPPPPPMDQGAMAVMPWVIIIIDAALYYYAHRQKQAGALRR